MIQCSRDMSQNSDDDPNWEGCTPKSTCRREVAAPMPLLPPVIRAVLLARGVDIWGEFVGGCYGF